MAPGIRGCPKYFPEVRGTQNEISTMEGEMALVKNTDAVKAYIDLLPDGILSSVISLLTMRDAVRTSVLASRWRCLSASLPNLNFDWKNVFETEDNYTLWHKLDNPCQQYKHLFVKSVDQLLNNYLGTRILMFRISFCLGRKFACDVDRWISFAVRLSVENLKLNFSCDKFILSRAVEKPVEYKREEYFVFPCHLLPQGKESKLKHCSLRSCILGPDLNDRFRSLKTLKLVDVPLAQSDVQRMFSSCLNLESLNLERCNLPVTLIVCGSLLRLKSLEIFFCFEVKKIELSAINLTTFEYGGNLVSFSFLKVPNLEKVHYWANCCRGLGYIFSQLGKDLPHVKALSVFTETKWVENIPKCLTTISKVKQLELYFQEREFHTPNIVAILKACPLLQKFHLVTFCPEDMEAYKNVELGGIAHNHLKEVVIGGFSGTDSQVAFAMYLVKYGVMLEQMVISVEVEFYQGGSFWTPQGNFYLPEVERNRIIQILQEEASSKKITIAMVGRKGSGFVPRHLSDFEESIPDVW